MLTRGRRRPAPAAGSVAEFANSVSVVGWIVEVDSEGRAYVDFAGNCAGPLAARLLHSCNAADVAACGPRPSVLLGFEGIDTSRPIILGLLRDRLPAAAPVAAAPAASATPSATPPGSGLPRVARVDGRRVELSAQDELELRCGRACITLRSDGTIVIKGGELHSRASGRNRITGSTVAIN